MLSSKLVRQQDANLVNQIVNHPDIYPWVCGPVEGPLDLSPVIADRNNVALFCEVGGILFHHHQVGVYEAHSCVLPEGRGPEALEIRDEAIQWMFERTGAVELITRVPQGNYAARAFTKSIKGVTLELRNPSGWVKDGAEIFADIFSLRIQDWIRHNEELDDFGDQVLLSLGDEEHRECLIERHLGACVRMMMLGQPYKGVIFYNRWAAMSGFTPIEIVTLNPLIIDFKSELVCVSSERIWVV